MTHRPAFAALALAAALGLAACSENSESRSPEEAAEAAEPQETGFTGDLGAATQEAVADTNAAASEAGTVSATPSAPAVDNNTDATDTAAGEQ
jgi:hypothetical protein